MELILFKQAINLSFQGCILEGQLFLTRLDGDKTPCQPHNLTGTFYCHLFYIMHSGFVHLTDPLANAVFARSTISGGMDIV